MYHVTNIKQFYCLAHMHEANGEEMASGHSDNCETRLITNRRLLNSWTIYVFCVKLVVIICNSHALVCA